MKDFAFMMRFWNGHGYEDSGKEVSGIDGVAKLTKWALKTVRPFQISITDLNPQDPIENPDAVKFAADWIKLKTDP